jgi:uncharacterized protein with GYD domain
MLTFIITATWTDQGIRAVKEVPKRAQASRDLAKKLDIDIKQQPSGRLAWFHPQRWLFLQVCMLH